VAAGDGEAYNAGKISGATGCVTSSLGMILLDVEDVEPKACLPGCKDDSDCESSYYCDSGACVPGVGAPCHPLAAQDFSGSEVFLSTRTPLCGTGYCIAVGLQGDPSPDCEENCADPEEVAVRLHCTCQCDGTTDDNSEFCKCPEGFSCIETMETGSSQGSYCINNEAFYYEDPVIRFR